MKKVVFLCAMVSFLLSAACIEKSACRKANPTNKRKKLDLAPGFK